MMFEFSSNGRRMLPYLVDAAFDTSGATTISHSLASVKPGGVRSDGSSKKVSIDLLNLFANQITLTGVYTGTREEFVDLMSFVVARGSSRLGVQKAT